MMGAQRIVRHHFVPRFYLSAWHANDGKGAWVYHFKHGKVREDRRFASSIAHRDNLYTIWPDANFSDREPSDEIERKFFGLIDNEASRIHQKLLDKATDELTAEDRLIWALFVNSLLYRREETLDGVRKESLEDWSNGAIPIPPRFTPYLAKLPVETIISNAALTAALSRISDVHAVCAIANMRWRTVTTSEATHLPTSDNPTVLNGGLRCAPIAYMSLALSPRLLLVLHPHDEDYDADFLKHLVFLHCMGIMRHASAYVVASAKLHDDGPFKYRRMLSQEFNTNSDA